MSQTAETTTPDEWNEAWIAPLAPVIGELRAEQQLSQEKPA